jgi:hypothetical protein
MNLYGPKAQEGVMKKAAVFFGLVFIVIWAQAAMCGEMSIGVTGGVNIATVAGDDADDWDSRTAPFFGGFLEFPITPLVSIQPELLYTMKGATSTDEEGCDVTAKLDYIEIPILLRVNVPMEGSIKPFLVAGPGLGFNSTAKMEYDGEEEDIEDVKSMDFGLIFGGGVGIPVGGDGSYMVSLFARYELGLTTIDDSEEEADVKNRAISIGAGIGF